MLDYQRTFKRKTRLCGGQYVNTLKGNCLVWNEIGWSDKRYITWLREHAKLRRTGKHPQ